MTSDALVEASIETVGHQVTPFPVQEPETKCVVGWKGGIGKTTLAQELAYLDDGVGGDMDWSKGVCPRAGATTKRREPELR